VQTKRKQRVLYYGTRKTDKLVRCYRKKCLDVFRVEIELHSRLLRDVATLDGFLFLPDVVYPKHFQFVAFDWGRLQQHLSRRPCDEGSRIIAGARRRSDSLQRARRYLNRKGVLNVHRFLVPLALNAPVRRALKRWVRQFKRNHDGQAQSYAG
jgi:hypothetical protein